jgi:hypothetical protein
MVFVLQSRCKPLLLCGSRYTLKCTLVGHVGFQPLTMDSRSNLTPEGFEPLTKSSRSNSPTNCTLTAPNLGVKLDFQEKTITVDEILLPMRNIFNLQLKPRITRALRENTCFAQEPISTRSTTKRMVKILDAKYEKADLPAIIRENCSHLTANDREKLLSVLLKFELLFDGTFDD